MKEVICSKGLGLNWSLTAKNFRCLSRPLADRLNFVWWFWCKDCKTRRWWKWEDFIYNYGQFKSSNSWKTSVYPYHMMIYVILIYLIFFICINVFSLIKLNLHEPWGYGSSSRCHRVLWETLRQLEGNQSHQNCLQLLSCCVWWTITYLWFQRCDNDFMWPNEPSHTYWGFLKC